MNVFDKSGRQFPMFRMVCTGHDGDLTDERLIKWSISIYAMRD